MSIWEDISSTFYQGDPELGSWFLVRNNVAPFVLCGLYVLVVKWMGPAIMKNRKPYKLREIMVIYNIIIAGIYAISVTKVGGVMLRHFLANKSLCNNFSMEVDIFAENAKYVWYLYLLKYVEFLDTIFFIMRKKPNLVTNLHVIHHAILPLIAWYLARAERSVFQGLPIVINSIIHLIMYSYYALAAMGPSVRKYLWWKRYLTLLQMAQFILIVLLQIVGVAIGGCKLGRATFYLNCIGAMFFFLLFCNYYIRSYVLKLNQEKNQ